MCTCCISDLFLSRAGKAAANGGAQRQRVYCVMCNGVRAGMACCFCGWMGGEMGGRAQRDNVCVRTWWPAAYLCAWRATAWSAMVC